MPTAKPRITITLSDEQHVTLQSLAQVQGVSMSSIVVDLLDTTLPVLKRLTEVLKNASEAPQAVLDGLKATLDDAEASMLGHGSAAMSQLDLLVQMSGGGGAGDAASAEAPAAAPEGRPPTSNRGVRIVPPESKNRLISPSKSRSSVDSNGRAKK
jgi:hypothetical protein